ncbi:MAG: recombination mediator RecR [Geoalkalibacter sp.]|jgi:recombination protein RecR|uniref:recombination mediator RecR n=1 Tax=Geoalkalibacter sp. TaxID=3041440 RepID=UPI002A9CD1A1|nr:recombination mediator RecR [Thermodesulfobacteriota bacterium]
MLDSIPSFSRLVAEMSKLPGIGRKTAARLVFHILKQPASEAEALAAAIVELKQRVVLCSNCFGLTEDDPCELCRDSSRDEHLLCIVEQPGDMIAIERSRSFRGRYHVLHGALSPLDGVGPEDLKVAQLEKRLADEPIREVVVATNFSVEGEATAHFLADLIKAHGIRVTRLAYGIPMGSDLEFVDEATVNRAVSGRRDL